MAAVTENSTKVLRELADSVEDAAKDVAKDVAKDTAKTAKETLGNAAGKIAQTVERLGDIDGDANEISEEAINAIESASARLSEEAKSAKLPKELPEKAKSITDVPYSENEEIFFGSGEKRNAILKHMEDSGYDPSLYSYDEFKEAQRATRGERKHAKLEEKRANLEKFKIDKENRRATIIDNTERNAYEAREKELTDAFNSGVVHHKEALKDVNGNITEDSMADYQERYERVKRVMGHKGVDISDQEAYDKAAEYRGKYKKKYMEGINDELQEEIKKAEKLEADNNRFKNMTAKDYKKHQWDSPEDYIRNVRYKEGEDALRVAGTDTAGKNKLISDIAKEKGIDVSEVGEDLINERRYNNIMKASKDDMTWRNYLGYYKVPQIATGAGGTLWLVNEMSHRRGKQSNAELYGQQQPYKNPYY